jgi:hypothetical protein
MMQSNDAKPPSTIGAVAARTSRNAAQPFTGFPDEERRRNHGPGTTSDSPG